MCYNKSHPVCQRTQSKPAENDSCHVTQAIQQQSLRGDGDKGPNLALHLPKFFSMMAEKEKGLKSYERGDEHF